MTTKHTPGPWHITDDGESQTCRLTVYVVSDGGDEYHTVAEVASFDGYPPGEQGEANARLIAAAPDLLAALEQLVADWESVDERVQVPDEINENAHWDAARAAIAKAKGE